MPNDTAMGDESLGELKMAKHKEDGITYPVSLHPQLCGFTLTSPSLTCAKVRVDSLKPPLPPKTGSEAKKNNDLIVEGLRDTKWEEPIESSPGGEGVRLGNMTSSLRDSFYRVLTVDNFEAFATKRAPAKNPGEYFSYYLSEHVHDSVHGWCGSAKVAPGDTSILQGHVSCPCGSI